MDLNGNDIAPGNLLRNCVLFGRLLRRLGVEITPTQMVDLVDSLKHVDIGSRRDFKNSARSVLINRRDHLEIFDHAFDLFWQARDKEELESLDLGMFLRKLEQPPQQIQTISPAESATGDEPQSDDSELDRTFTYSNVELLRQKDFGEFSDDEVAAARARRC